jgi:hypothetical protein
VPMLEAVGHAIVVNPDAELTRLAREHGWEVLRLDRLVLGLTAFGGVVLAALIGALSAAVILERRRSA